MGKLTRRGLFSMSSSLMGAAAVASALPARIAATGNSSAPQEPSPDDLPEIHKKKKLKVYFAGAHTDDWLLCAGTLARYAKLGHEVKVISLTPGNSISMADVEHMSVEKLAAARREQAVRGTRMIGASIRFLKEDDLKVRVTPETYQAFNRLLLPENPDVVFTLWPLSYHPDHRAAGNLALNAWLQGGLKFALLYCGNPGGGEDEGRYFNPNHYVDVESVKDLKKKTWLANTFDAKSWPHMDMGWQFRGHQCGCQYAEAFIWIQTRASMPPRNLYPKWWYWGGLRLSHG